MVLLEVDVVVVVSVVSFVTCTLVSFVVPLVAVLNFFVFLEFLFRRCRNPFDPSPIVQVINDRFY